MATYRARRTCPDAFTLIEIMIVVTIIAIIAALLVPMIGTTSDVQLRGAAGMLAADLDYARVESIAHGDNERLFVVNSTTQYSITTVATTNTPITNPITNQPYTVTYGASIARQFSGVTIQSYSFGGTSQLQFGLYGELPTATTNATITLACTTHTAQLTINSVTGEVSVGTIN